MLELLPVDALLFLGCADDFLNRDALLKLLIRLGVKAGVPDCHPHRFRHTFALKSLRSGENTFELRTYLALAQADAAWRNGGHGRLGALEGVRGCRGHVDSVLGILTNRLLRDILQALAETLP